VVGGAGSRLSTWFIYLSIINPGSKTRKWKQFIQNLPVSAENDQWAFVRVVV
jgi:hypothetical protein